MKPHIYRPGDKVRIVNPKFVRRVGYPLVWYEVSDEQLYADPRICGALRALGLLPGTKAKGDLFSGAGEIPRHLQIAFAKEFVAQNRFGGNARTIHYYGDDQPPAIVFDTAMWNAYYGAGTVHTVISRRHVKTGTRYAGYHHGSGWDADYAPGGLEDMKVHTLLKLSDSVELEACNVEPA